MNKIRVVDNPKDIQNVGELVMWVHTHTADKVEGDLPADVIADYNDGIAQDYGRRGIEKACVSWNVNVATITGGTEADQAEVVGKTAYRVTLTIDSPGLPKEEADFMLILNDEGKIYRVIRSKFGILTNYIPTN